MEMEANRSEDLQYNMKPAYSEHNIPVCIVGDNNYVPYIGVTLQSIIEHCNKKFNYDIIILGNNISEDNQVKLFSLIQERSNIKLRFINCVEYLKQLKVSGDTVYTINTYLRFCVLTDLFQMYHKVITLDSDLIVNEDISVLYQTDLDGKLIGAVNDSYIQIIINKKLHGDKIIGYQPVSSYFKDMHLNEKQYFNAGVILWDLNQCRNEKMMERAIKICEEKTSLMYADQDVLNLLFAGNYRQLPLTWNGMSPYALMKGAAHASESDLPENYLLQVSEAKIIHYLGIRKPWQDKEAFYCDEYMKYAKKTPWKNFIVQEQRKWKNNQDKKADKLFDQLFPIGSRRRKKLLKYSYRLNDYIHGWKV